VIQEGGKRQQRGCRGGETRRGGQGGEAGAPRAPRREACLPANAGVDFRGNRRCGRRGLPQPQRQLACSVKGVATFGALLQVASCSAVGFAAAQQLEVELVKVG